MQFKKTLISTAVAATVGVAAGLPMAANADMVTGSWSGTFTMLNASGAFTPNNDTAPCLTEAQANAWNGAQTYTGGCNRTFVTGTLSFDTATGAGSGTVAAFSFFGGGEATATTISFQSIGNGFGGPGSLVLGNMGFNWNGNAGIPVSIVLDATGFFAAVGGGLTVSQTITGGVLPASGSADGAFGAGAVLATTTWNTTNFDTDKNGTPGPIALGDNPSGTLPLVADAKSIGGSPMRTVPFAGFNANFDIASLHVTTCTDTGTGTNACGPVVPVPAAVWLFGSGLLGLVGVARRRKSK